MRCSLRSARLLRAPVFRAELLASYYDTCTCTHIPAAHCNCNTTPLHCFTRLHFIRPCKKTHTRMSIHDFAGPLARMRTCGRPARTPDSIGEGMIHACDVSMRIRMDPGDSALIAFIAYAPQNATCTDGQSINCLSE